MPYDREHGKLWQDIKADLDKTRTRASKFAAAAEWAFGKKTARVLGGVALFAVLVSLLFVFLDLYVAPKYASGRKDLVLAVAQILGGTALLAGLYFTWRTLQVNREGQITDRFTRAIDQLGKTDDEGNKLFEIRVGGIYALERIGRESEVDYWPIMEVLTAYVRQHSSRRGPKEGQKDMQGEAREKKSSRTRVRLLDPDIQAIMTVIRRRSRSFEHGESEPLDLRGTYLGNANLWEADLSGALLWGADLSGAQLSGSNLSKAYLMGVGFSGADLSGADFSGANLRGAALTQAQLEEATGDRNTLLPSGLKRPAHWGLKPDEQIEGE